MDSGLPVRIMVVDDYPVTREMLALMLNEEQDLEVIAEAGTAADVDRELAAGLVPDVAIVDLMLGDRSGIDVLRVLRRVNPRTQILVVTGSNDRTMHALAVQAGAGGVLHKSVPTAEIVDAVRRLARGEPLISMPEAVALLTLAGEVQTERQEAAQRFARLTAREREVLQALADGLDNTAMATRFSISEETVRAHVRNLLGKLGVDSRLLAVAWAYRHGFITLDGR